MIIKKFTGKTEAEATEAAKKELGSTLVIMNVREVKKKGLFAFLLPKQIEVTAALEEEALLLQERVLENNKQTGKGYADEFIRNCK